MAKTLDQRLAAAKLIKDETIPNANTAPRVGGAMEDMNNAWNEELGEINVTTAFPPTSGYHTPETARAAVPDSYKRKGRTISYQTAAGTWVKEQYRGDSTAAWTTASNWFPILMAADQNVYNVTNQNPLAAGEYYNPTTARAAVPNQIRKLNLGLKYLSGYKEIDTLTITGPALTDGSISIFLNGVKNTASPVIYAGDTAIDIATKIRIMTWAGWIVGGTPGTAVVTFTRTTYDPVSAPTFSSTAGITSNFVRTTTGQTPEWIHEEFIGPSTASWTTATNWRKIATATDLAQIETDVNAIDSLFIQTGNIYEPESVVDNMYITQSGNVSGAQGWKYCVQPVEPSTEYVIRNPNYDYVPTSIGGIGFLNASGVLISSTNFSLFPSFKNGKIFTTHAECTKIQFNVKNSTGTIDFHNKMELYVGTTTVPDSYNAPRTLRDLLPLFDPIYNAAKQSAITEGFSKNYFTPDSLFTNIDIDGIIKVEAQYDISRVLSDDLYLWFISNGNESNVERVIYVATKVNGGINSGTIVSAYIGDYAIKTGVEKVHLESYNDSGVDLYMVIDWSKIPYRTTEYTSTDTKLDINYITKQFEDEFELRVYNRYVVDPPKNFITNVKGDIINTPLLSKIDFDWEIGYVYLNNIKVAHGLFALSLPVPVSAGDIISAPSIPSLSYGHAFINDAGTVIQMFGMSNSSTWGDPEIREYIVPAGATKVQFSWYNTEIYWNSFKVSGVSGVLAKEQIGTDLTWENGYSYNIEKRAKVANASFAISNKVNASSLFVRVKSQNISETVGVMCYDKNYAPLGVVASHSETAGELITIRLLNFTKYIAFTSLIGSTNDFTYQFTSGVLFTSQTGLSYATLYFGVGVTVKDIEIESVQSFSKISGKNGISFGDSITWYDGQLFVSSHVEAGQRAIGYQSYIRDYFKCNILNMGESGYTMPTIYNNKILTANYSDVDFITLTSGANDARLGVPIGVLADVGSSFITSTYAGAMQAAIEHILSQNPRIMIFLLTPIKGWFLENGTVDVPGSYPDIPTDYPNMMKMIGNLYSLPVIDMYGMSFINKITRPIYMGDEDMWDTQPAAYYLHPTNEGFRVMGEFICKQISSIL